MKKLALVTGGTRGIGLAITKSLSHSFERVLITGTSECSFDSFPRSEFKNVDFLPVNFENDSEVDEFLKLISKEDVDVVVNNAGINKINLTHEIDPKDFDRIQKVNVRAPFMICKTLCPQMAKRGYGRVVNITSIFGHVTKSQRLSYTTSKFGLLGMTKTLALDYAEGNVLVNAVAPGFIDTELTRRVLSGQQIQELTSMVPMKRLGRPEEIAETVAFLASEKNTFLTGQNLIVDGGFTCV